MSGRKPSAQQKPVAEDQKPAGAAEGRNGAVKSRGQKQAGTPRSSKGGARNASQVDAEGIEQQPALDGEEDDDSDEEEGGKKVPGRRRLSIDFISDKNKRHITFSKRKGGIFKKAKELALLTGSQVLLVVTSETGNIYDYSTPKFKPVVDRCRDWIRASREAPQAFDLTAATSANANSQAAKLLTSPAANALHAEQSALFRFQLGAADADPGVLRPREEGRGSRALDLIADAAMAEPRIGGAALWQDRRTGRMKRERGYEDEDEDGRGYSHTPRSGNGGFATWEEGEEEGGGGGGGGGVQSGGGGGLFLGVGDLADVDLEDSKTAKVLLARQLAVLHFLADKVKAGEEREREEGGAGEGGGGEGSGAVRGVGVDGSGGAGASGHVQEEREGGEAGRQQVGGEGGGGGVGGQGVASPLRGSVFGGEWFLRAGENGGGGLQYGRGPPSPIYSPGQRSKGVLHHEQPKPAPPHSASAPLSGVDNGLRSEAGGASRNPDVAADAAAFLEWLKSEGRSESSDEGGCAAMIPKLKQPRS